MTSLIRSLNAQQNALLQSPTGNGKTLSLLYASLTWLKYFLIFYSNNLFNKNICTNQTSNRGIKKKTGYQPKIVVSASRDHACCNKQLRSVFGKSKELECRKRLSLQNGKKCDYARIEFAYPDLIEKVTSKVRDLEQLVQFGNRKCFALFIIVEKLNR